MNFPVSKVAVKLGQNHGHYRSDSKEIDAAYKLGKAKLECNHPKHPCHL